MEVKGSVRCLITIGLCIYELFKASKKDVRKEKLEINAMFSTIRVVSSARLACRDQG